MTKPHELRDMTDEDLERTLADAKEELFNLRFQLVTGQLDNPMRIKEVRHELARLLTVLREREIAVAEGVELAVPEESKKRRRRRERKAKAEAAEAAGETKDVEEEA
jgi:large subunit ribosomal protein L29